MSTYANTPTSTGPENGSSLQLAPRENKGPDFGDLKVAYERCLSDNQSFVDQTRQNYLTRYALWAGQSSDGKKHAREGSKIDPTPWEGASDLRIYEVDGAINRKVALYRMAFKRANIIASPVEGADSKRARVVSNLMRWLTHTQIPDVDREVELLANLILEKGIGAVGIFWEEKQEKALVTVTVQEIQAKFPNIDIVAALMDDSVSDGVAGIFEEQYGCSGAKAKKMIKELREVGTTTVVTLGKKRSYPVLRTFDLAENLFIPPDTTDLERAPGIYRIEYYTPETLRGLVQSAGWDEDWVEAAIETCRGKSITLDGSQFTQPLNRSFVYQKETKLENLVGCAYAYQRLSDEDGNPGTYLTIFNPNLPPDERQKGYAKSGLLEYRPCQYPFELFRREYLSRRLHDTRGLPEPGKSFQDAIKAHRDSRIDAASIAIIPPIGFPMGRPPARWGPGARVPERRPGEYHFLDKPSGDPLTEQSETILVEKFKDYCGFLSKDGDPQYVQAITQNEVDKFLTQLARVFSQIYSRYAQYGDDKVSFRVMGLSDQQALEYVKSDIGESFDWFLQFDVQSTDVDKMEKRWSAIIQGIQLLNRDGNVNFARTIQAYIESIDPVIAERILEPTTQARDRIVKEEQDDLAAIFAGVPRPIKIGTPPQIGIQVMQEYVKNAPDVQQRLQQDQAFRQRIETRLKQYQQQEDQEKNKLIGVYGAVQPGQTQ